MFDLVRAQRHFQCSKCISRVAHSPRPSKGPGTDKWDMQAGSDRHDQMRAFVFCADCFDYGKQASPNPQVEWTEEMTSLFKWLATHKDNRTMVMIFDGRSKECRRKIDEWMMENYEDENRQVELWVTYAGLTADLREPKRRRVAFSDTCRECVMVGLPIPKVSMKINTALASHPPVKM